MIEIYGSPRSSAGRCYALLEELGVAYRQVPLEMARGEHKSDEYLKLNPNGKVPCMVDGNVVIWESLAINHYLADKYRPELLGHDVVERACVQQWSIWGLVELQDPLVEMLIQLVFVPEAKRNLGIVERAKAKLPALFKILDQALAASPYLAGDRFTLADINVASVINVAATLHIPLTEYKNITTWYSGIKSRPSFQKFLVHGS